MSSIRLRQSLTWTHSRVLLAFFLGSVLVACGAKPVTASRPPQHPTSSAHPASSPTQSPPALSGTADSSLQPNTSNITVDLGSLEIQSAAGIQCPDEWYEESPIALDQLVLASDQLAYTQDEIAQMRSYLNTIINYYQTLTTGATPPPTLRWVLGGSTDEIPGAFANSAITGGEACGAMLELTNTGNSDIQISRVGIQITAPPQSNPYQYRLIDLCSVSTVAGGCGPELGGQGQCDEYSVDIQIGAGEKNATFSGIPEASSSDCGPLTIDPDSQVFLTMNFSLAPGAQKNAIYQVDPLITLDTGQGEQTQALPRLASTLAFADVSQFSCYQLHGTTFVLVSSPVFSASPGLWCI